MTWFERRRNRRTGGVPNATRQAPRMRPELEVATASGRTKGGRDAIPFSSGNGAAAHSKSNVEVPNRGSGAEPGTQEFG